MIRWLGEQPPPGGRGVEEVSERAARGEDDMGSRTGHTGGEGGPAVRDHGRCNVSGQV